MKNATGYDFRYLLIGSEGTLGLLAEIDVQLTAAPEPQTVMVLGVPRVGDLLSILEALMRCPSAFEFFSDVALEKVRAHRDLPAPLARPKRFMRWLSLTLQLTKPQKPHLLHVWNPAG